MDEKIRGNTFEEWVVDIHEGRYFNEEEDMYVEGDVWEYILM